MSNEFAVPILGAIFMENFELEGLQKALGCSREEAFRILAQKKARQDKALRQTFDALRRMRPEFTRAVANEARQS